MATKIRESRLIPYNLQIGLDVPLHLSPAGTIYYDSLNEIQYLNKDGLNNWQRMLDESKLISTNSVTATTYSLSILSYTTYYGIDVNANVDLTLPDNSNYNGHIIIIKDEGGHAKKHRIRVTPSSGTIEGTNYVDMNLAYMSLQIIARNNNWWII